MIGNALQMVWAWLKHVRWVVWAGIALAVGMLLFILKLLFDHSPLKQQDGTLLPQVPKALQDKVDRTEEAALQQRAAAKATADTDRAELDRIAAEKDGVERRRRLAEMLKRL